MVIVRAATPSERGEWDQLVARFPNCRIVHKQAWIEWLETCGCGTPLYLVLEQAGEVVGAIPGLPGGAIGTGWRGTGYKFAPLVGRTLMELSFDTATVEDISRFAPERFEPSRAG